MMEGPEFCREDCNVFRFSNTIRRGCITRPLSAAVITLCCSGVLDCDVRPKRRLFAEIAGYWYAFHSPALNRSCASFRYVRSHRIDGSELETPGAQGVLGLNRLYADVARLARPRPAFPGSQSVCRANLPNPCSPPEKESQATSCSIGEVWRRC